MSDALISTVLSQAGRQIFRLLADQAGDAANDSDDPIYTVIEHWAIDIVELTDLERAFHTAQEEYENYTDNPERWLEYLAALFRHGGSAVPELATNLWLTYTFYLQDAHDAIWAQYPALLREVMIRTDLELPPYWGSWVQPMQNFMRIAERTLAAESDAFDLLIITEKALELLEMSYQSEPQPSPPEPPPGDAPGISYEPVSIASILNAYLTVSREQIGYMDARGYMRSAADIMIPISEIYVPLDLIPFKARGSFTDYMRYRTASYDKPDYYLSGAPVDIDNGEDSPAVSIHDALKDEAILILGESGSGKTTLLRHLLLKHIDILLNPDLQSIQYEFGRDEAVRIRLSQPMPIYVNLAHYIDEKLVNEELENFVFRTSADMIGDTRIIYRLSELADQGQCLFLLDGLDQAPTDELHRMLIQNVTEAVESWRAAGNKVVIASRLPERAAAPLPPEFKPYLIQRLDHVKIDSFIFRWMLALLRRQNPFMRDEEVHHRAEERMMELLRELSRSPRLHQLARKPLLLRLLISTYQPGTLPLICPTGIFTMAADSLLREWRLPQSPTGDVSILKHDAVIVLGMLAEWIHEARGSGHIEESSLRNILNHFWSQLYPEASREITSRMVDNFLELARRGNGPFVDLGHHRYGFIYNGIEEYFAARHLVSSYWQAAERIRDKLHDPRWDEVIRMAIGFTAVGSQKNASDLIETAILARGHRAAEQEFTPSPFEDLLKRDLFFAATLLGGGVEVDTRVKQIVVGALMELWLDGESTSLGRMNMIFDSARRYLAELSGTSASYYAFQQAENCLISHDEHRQAYAIDALTFWPEHLNDGQRLLIGLRHEHPRLVQEALAYALGRIDNLRIEAYQLLLLLAMSSNEGVDAAGQYALRRSPPLPEVALQMWQGYLRSQDRRQRRIALDVIRRLGSAPSSIIDDMLHLLNQSDHELRLAVIETFNAITDLPAYALIGLTRSAQTTNAEIRQATIEVLDRPIRLPDEVVEYLIDWTHDPAPEIRHAAIQALGSCKNNTPGVVSALVEQLRYPGDRGKAEAIECLALKAHSEQQLAHVLVHVVEDRVIAVRRAVAAALRHFPEPDETLRGVLKTLLTDSEMDVREAALESVAAMRHPGEEIIKDYLVPMVNISNLRISTRTVRALAALRGLPDEALLRLVQALPMHGEAAGREIVDCVTAHIPLSIDVVDEIMDLSISRSLSGRQSQRNQIGQQALALEMLGCVIKESPDMTRILVQQALNGESEEIQIAALRGLANARAMWTEVQEALFSLLHHNSHRIRYTAAISLGTLIRNLPALPFEAQELLSLAEEVSTLLGQVRPRASWRPDTEVQNDLLHALSWIVSRARPRRPRLSAYSKDPGSQFN